jgi:hypothetical protein
MGYPQPIINTATIAAGATGLSDVILLGELRLAGVIMPAAWQAASLTFQSCDTENGTFTNVYYDSGSGTATEATATVSTSRRVMFTGDLALALNGCGKYIKLRSGTAALAVDQTATRSIGLIGIER